MKALNDILTKVKFDKNADLVEAHNDIIALFEIGGWIEFGDNEVLFNEAAKANCKCRFDDGTECRYNDQHPTAILTHFKYK